MASLVEIGILLGTTVCGYGLFRLCRVPMPAFLGPMVFAGALNYFYLYPDLPLAIPFFLCKVLIGITLGRRFDRGVLAELKDLPLPALLTSVWMMGASLAAGFLLYAWSDVSLATALIGSAAGGVAEMTIFAMVLGADVVVVAFIQLFRLVFTILAIPFITRFWNWYADHGRCTAEPPTATETATEAVTDKDALPFGRALPQGRFRPFDYVLLVLAALCGGGLLEWLHVPAGGMLGGMVGTASVVIATGRDCILPRQMTPLSQFGIGTVVAKSMTHDTILVLGGLIGPLFLPTFILLVLCLSLSAILKRMTTWNAMTCILATMPAGLIQVVPVADEYGADVLKVGVLHIVRLVSIIVLLPMIIRLIIT